jgi:EamA-like transporter family
MAHGAGAVKEMYLEPFARRFVALGLSVHFQCGLFLRDRLHSDWQGGVHQHGRPANRCSPGLANAAGADEPRAVIGVLAGFLGVLVIIRPGSEVFKWAALIIVFSALMNGLYQIFTREIADTEAAQTSAIYSSVVRAFGMFLVLPFVWRPPSSLGHVALILQSGCVGRDEPLLRRTSLRFAPVNIVTPFQYVQMLGSVLVGYLLFGDLPDAPTWLGAAIVIVSGLYIGWTQTRRRKREKHYGPALARESD